MNQVIANAFTDELEKIAIDPISLSAALGGTWLGGKTLKEVLPGLARKLGWKGAVVAGAIGAVGAGEAYNRYRKKKNRKSIGRRYGVINALTADDM